MQVSWNESWCLNVVVVVFFFSCVVDTLKNGGAAIELRFLTNNHHQFLQVQLLYWYVYIVVQSTHRTNFVRVNKEFVELGLGCLPLFSSCTSMYSITSYSSTYVYLVRPKKNNDEGS